MSVFTDTIRQDINSLNRLAKKAARQQQAKQERHGLRLGAIPSPADLLPQNFTDTALPAVGLMAGTLTAHAVNLSTTDSLSVGAVTALALIIGRRIETAQQRRGCILKEGGVFIREPWEKAQRSGAVDAELTAIYKKILNDDEAFVERRQSDQYNIHLIYNDDPATIKTKLVKIALKIGQKPEQFLFYPVWAKGCSAVLSHRPESEWNDNIVTFDKDAVVSRRMILQAGRSINGDTMTYNRETYPHALIAGETGAGKTEAMVADLFAARATGLNPKVIIIDPKNTPQLKRLTCDLYTNQTEDVHQVLLDVVAECEDRLNTYSAAGCDNFWKYLEKHPNEKPLLVYIDEVAELVSPDVSSSKKQARETAEAIKMIIGRLVAKYRSAGLFVTLGMQHPLAEVLGTVIRNNLGTRIVLSVADSTAAKVAGAPGAENLPMQGGMILKSGKTVTYGRGIYIQH